MTSCINQLRHYGGIIRHGTTNRLARSNLILMVLLAMIFQTNAFAQKQGNANTVTVQGNEVVIIDKELPDQNVLLAGLKPNVKVEYFSKHSDFFTNVKNALNKNKPVSALHILTHGNSGAISFSYDYVDKDILQSRSEYMKTWKNNFTKDAGIYLYGCEIANGNKGKEFCDLLSDLSGATVAASTDKTGHLNLDANWDLEFQTAESKQTNVSTPLLKSSYKHSLHSVLFFDIDAGGTWDSQAGATFYSNNGHTGVTSTTLPASLDAYKLVYIIQPTRLLTNAEITTISNYLAKGGTVCFQGEHSGYTPTQNANISDAVIRLGAHFSIIAEATDGGWTTCNQNLKTSGVIKNHPYFTGVNTIDYNYMAPIAMAGAAQVLISHRTDASKTYMALERISNGNVVMWADQNIWDNVTNTACNQNGVFFINLLNFSAENITSNAVAALTTTEAYSISGSSAYSGGNITDDKGSPITQRGICWSTSTQMPTTANNPIYDTGGGLGLFSRQMTGLSLNTTYYVRAFAISANGTAYGNSINFTTPAVPNNAPNAVADVYSCQRGGTITGNVQSNDYDLDGDVMTCTRVTAPAYHSGTFTLNGNGTFTYTNNGNVAPGDYFSYYLSDGKSTSGTVGVSISVYTPTTPPTGGNGSITTNSSGLYSFKSADFTYNSSSGSAFNGINIITLPAKGILKYNGLAISAGATCNDVTKLTYDQNGLTGTNPYTSFTFKVLDMTGQPSTSSYTMTINSGLIPPNSAPVLYNEGAPKLTDQVQNNLTPAGTLVSAIIASSTANGGNMITDADAGNPEGIAIVSAETLNGGWQYTINGGTTWLDLGVVSATSARLLGVDANTKLRFVPAAGSIGTANITIRAWDQFTGTNGSTANVSTNGGNTAFSTATETVSVTLTPANNPTVLTLTTTTRDFYENDLAFSIDPDMTVNDVENDNLDGAVVTILNNFKQF